MKLARVLPRYTLIMVQLFQTFWISVRCVCSPDIAAQFMFQDDHEPRRSRFTAPRPEVSIH